MFWSVFLCAVLMFGIFGAAARGASEEKADAYERQRDRMVTHQLVRRGITDAHVIRAMRLVPRHLFVSKRFRRRAYHDGPLPIGHGQTISQPYVVALMTQLIRPGPGDRVLEIGTGSGYQAAVLGEIVREVYTVEIVPELAASARDRLAALGYENVHVKAGDGFYGWEEHAPFDAILVTAALDYVPPPLVAQLEVGGRLCMPVGREHEVQSLMLYEKKPDGTIEERKVIEVRFVPLVGEH